MEQVPSAATVPETTDGCVLWHRRNLRTTDHSALAHAASEYETLLPLFVFDPVFYGSEGLACDARLRFLHDSLRSLDRLYDSVGGTLSYAHGEASSVLAALTAAGWDVVATADPTARYGRERDDEATEQFDVTFVGGDGLVRGRERSREGWADHIENWFESTPPDWQPADVSFQSLTDSVPISRIESTYGVAPEKSALPEGGRKRAVERLASFVDRIGAYPGNISAPSDARTGTSQLSPYLRFGSLSVREVYQYVDEHAPEGPGKEMFFSRLFWNKHYHQKLADWEGWTTKAVNPVMRGFRADTHDPTLVEAWKRGETGFPMVDASMRCLVETGWLNFRMRAMCASFYADLLAQPWRIGADFFHYHLVDSDPAINYTQWQSQAGTVGKNLMRIYNPRKQVRDNDPDGSFIKRYVPELGPLPAQYLDQPEKTPLAEQEAHGVVIGEDYPYPVVEYERARQHAMDRYEEIRSAAVAALHRPEVARRASLSNRPQPPADANAETGTGRASSDGSHQEGLSAFSDEETDRR